MNWGNAKRITRARSAEVADVTILSQSLLAAMSEPSMRKLLIFADNRQDAAFQAGWMEERARRFRLRHLLYRLLNNASGSILGFEQLVELVHGEQNSPFSPIVRISMKWLNIKTGSESVMLAVIFLLSACNMGASQNVEPTADPFSCAERDRPLIANEGGFSLDCSCIGSVSLGPGWRGLTIGSSTLEDIQSVLRTKGSHDPHYDSWRFWQLEDKLDWGSAEACFVDNKLSALYIKADIELRKFTLQQLLEKYGVPERVTWGSSHQNRSLIWPEQGVLVFMGVYNEHPGSLLIFPPIPAKVLETSWLLALLPNGPDAPPEDVVLGSEYDMEDPWGIER